MRTERIVYPQQLLYALYFPPPSSSAEYATANATSNSSKKALKALVEFTYNSQRRFNDVARGKLESRYIGSTDEIGADW